MAGLCVAVPSQGLDVPPGDSFAAVVEQTKVALKVARQIGPLVGLDAAVLVEIQVCDVLSEAGRRIAVEDVTPCFASLTELFDALRARRAAASPLSAAAIDRAITQVADAAFRVELMRASLAAGRTDRIAPPGVHATQNLLARDGRTLLVKPLTALRAGRRYALSIEGLSPDEKKAVDASVVPQSTSRKHRLLRIPDGAFTSFADRQLAGAPGIDLTRLASLLAQLETEAETMPGLGTFAGARITLPEPLRSDQLGTLSIAFVPLRNAREELSVAAFRTLSARTGLLAYRSRLEGRKCGADTMLAALPPAEIVAEPRHVARLARGTLPSLDILGDAESRALGVRFDAASFKERPYFLALPARFDSGTPLVIAVNGHVGTARRMLAQHAEALTARGMAVLAIDLPEHGERAREGKDILDVLDPSVLSANLRQAAVDVIAALHFASECGFALPGEERWTPTRIRYFGYSLGGMVGVMVRSVEPYLGTTVLIAPGGDIVGWLMLRIAPELGATYVTCLGGPEDGKTCITKGKCAPPGECIVDPWFELLYQSLDQPYELVSAGADPLGFATERTRQASDARLLIITGGEDPALHPALASRLADAYGMRPSGAYVRRGPRSMMVQWPALGHDLIDNAGVREQAYEFLASDGRKVLLSDQTNALRPPGWYDVFGPMRR